MTPHRCAKCGATIDPLLHECPYCKFVTPTGAAARQHQINVAHQAAQWSAHAQHQQVAAARSRLDGTATQALAFGIAGLVLFCTPFGIAGIVQGFRARAMAAGAQTPVPGKATVGLVLSIVSLVTSIGGLMLAAKAGEEDKARADAEAAAIEKKIGARASAVTLERDVACGLVQAHLLREGHETNRGSSLSDFQCVGKLVVTSPDHAEIDLVRVKYISTPIELRACLKRGGTWYVAKTTKSGATCPP